MSESFPCITCTKYKRFSTKTKPSTTKNVNIIISERENRKSWLIRPILIRCLDDSSMSADKRNGIIAIINMYHHSSEFAIIILPINTATIIILLIMVNFLSSHLAIDDPCCMRKNKKYFCNCRFRYEKITKLNQQISSLWPYP